MPSEEQDWPAGYDRVVLDDVDSTMAEAGRRARSVAGPTWIMAHRQTAGRGRQGRPWIAPEGNLSATLILPDPGPPLHSAQRSFVTALALHKVLWGMIEPDALGAKARRTQLKWPNDVLVDGRKIAGILLEAHGGTPGYLAIGVGVNLVAAPPLDAVEARAVPPIALAEVATPPAAEDFLARLAVAFAYEEMWFRETGFARTRRAWLEHAARLGETITARAGPQETTGTFTDVDKDGQLVLETAKGRVVIPAADVYF